MTVNTGISWTDHTVNFWTGCKKVSAGCKFCYMYRDFERYGKEPTDVLQVKQATINKHLKEAKPGDKIFTCSWSDFFIEEADQWRDWAWDIIRQHPQFIWQILTKRPERIKQCLPEDWADGWPNVWIGVSVENQEAADTRIPILLSIPAKVRWLSCEPLLDEVDLSNYFSFDYCPEEEKKHPDECVGCLGNGRGDCNAVMRSKLDWVVIGGESGNDIGKYSYRQCELDWIVDLLEQCATANVAVWVKQMGTHLQKVMGLSRHGADINEWPAKFRVQKFPTD